MAVGKEHLVHHASTVCQIRKCFNLSRKMGGQFIQMDGVNAAILRCLTQQGVHDDAVIFDISHRIGGAGIQERGECAGMLQLRFQGNAPGNGTHQFILIGIAQFHHGKIDL